MDLLNDVELDDEVKSKIAERMSEYVQKQLEESTTGLKSKVDELLAEKKKVQQEKTAAMEAAKREAEEKAKAENDYKQLFESQKSEAEQLRALLEQKSESERKQKILSQADILASRLTKDTAKASLLKDQISRRLTLVDDEIRVADESGQLTVSTLDDLAASIKGLYPFLVDGSQANGGGAARGQSGAASQEKVLSRADFDAMDDRKRAEFFKSGGKLSDD
jgi:sRNA-binding protein